MHKIEAGYNQYNSFNFNKLHYIRNNFLNIVCHTKAYVLSLGYTNK